jgi:hypothetical protein
VNHPTRQALSVQVYWFEVWLYMNRIIEGLGVQAVPPAGTPAWCGLEDNDPAKLAAALLYAPHWALKIDAGQEAMAGASRDIAGAVDWTRVGKRVRDSSEFYAAHPWLRRVT